jgi:hypothetical protein
MGRDKERTRRLEHVALHIVDGNVERGGTEI